MYHSNFGEKAIITLIPQGLYYNEGLANDVTWDLIQSNKQSLQLY